MTTQEPTCCESAKDAWRKKCLAYQAGYWRLMFTQLTWGIRYCPWCGLEVAGRLRREDLENGNGARVDR